MKDYIDLGNRISWGESKLVSKFLSLNKNLDVLHYDGSFFIRAIEDNNYDIVNTLLEYFRNNQLSKYEPRSLEFSNLKKKMYDIIELAIEDVKLTEEMEKVLAPYLPQEEEDYQLDLMNDLLVTEDNYNPDYKTFETVKTGEHHPLDQHLI